MLLYFIYIYINKIYGNIGKRSNSLIATEQTQDMAILPHTNELSRPAGEMKVYNLGYATTHFTFKVAD